MPNSGPDGTASPKTAVIDIGQHRVTIHALSFEQMARLHRMYKLDNPSGVKECMPILAGLGCQLGRGWDLTLGDEESREALGVLREVALGLFSESEIVRIAACIVEFTKQRWQKTALALMMLPEVKP